MKNPHLILYGHFGVGNLGNDSTLEAMVFNIRKYLPSAAITCVCTGPEVIAERFGIDTLPIDVNEDRNLRWTSEKQLPKALRLASRAGDEIGFWTSRTRWLRSSNQFMVVGTGALDDMAVSHPWNAPYDLFKWCRAAKLAGTRVSFVSVGAGPILNSISRRLMLSALSAADYRSYRDEISMEYLQSVGFDTQGDQVFPDLVFSLPKKINARPRHDHGDKLTVGLGVIGYYGWRHDPQAGAQIYQEYVTKLKQLVGWLLSQGHTVRLLTGDLPTDLGPVEELLHYVRAEGQAYWGERVIAEDISGIEDLYNQVPKTDIVIASRFHNVVCALMLGIPVISIGYHGKNDSLLSAMGLRQYCQHIESFSVELLIKQVQSLIQERDRASRLIEQRSNEYRQLLEEQYRRILLPEDRRQPAHSRLFPMRQK